MTRACLSLVLPDFAIMFANELNRPLLTGSFKTLLRKAQFRHDSTGFYQHLLTLFSDNQSSNDIPMAQLRGANEQSLCADPCYLHPDRDKLLLFCRGLELSLEEARAYATFLQPLFDEMQATLQVQTPEQWLLNMQQATPTAFFSKEGLHGQPVTDYLPKGAQADNWIRLWNEIQMVLFDCPLNQTREAQGKTPINSLWFWGHDSLPENWQAWQYVSGQDEVLQRLVTFSQSNYFSHAQFADTKGKKSLHIANFDVDKNWQQQLDKLADNWLKPAFAALKKNQLRELNVIVPEWGVYQLTPLSIWRFL